MNNVANAFVDFYRLLFGTSVDTIPIDAAIMSSGPKIPKHSKEAMIKPISRQ
mgnify:CR=1 FL=1